MWRVDCIHCSMLFYIRDLSIQRFWYLRGSWNQSLVDTEEQLGSEKLHVDLTTQYPKPALFKGQLYFLYVTVDTVQIPTVHKMALQLPCSFIIYSDGDGQSRKDKPRKMLIHPLIDGIRFMTSDLNSNETVQLITLPHLRYLTYQGFCFYDCAD